jgi:hypothetical protein
MSKKPTHGGPRKGSGRPKGKKSANAKGRTAVTRSVSMQPKSWANLDRLRGTQSRGKFIESMLPATSGSQKYELAMDFKSNTLHRIPL